MLRKSLELRKRVNILHKSPHSISHIERSDRSNIQHRGLNSRLVFTLRAEEPCSNRCSNNDNQADDQAPARRGVSTWSGMCWGKIEWIMREGLVWRDGIVETDSCGRVTSRGIGLVFLCTDDVFTRHLPGQRRRTRLPFCRYLVCILEWSATRGGCAEAWYAGFVSGNRAWRTWIIREGVDCWPLIH